MYFEKYYLYYIGYSLTKNINNIELYKNENIYLKVKFSLKNKLKYLGYTNLFYHIIIDKDIHININKNINEIVKKLHFYLNILKNNIYINEPKFKFEKSINNFLKNNKIKIIYDNEFNISFNIYKKDKINFNFNNKNIVFIRDIYDSNSFSALHLEYIYYLLDLIISKNKSIKNILFEFIDEQFDVYFTNNINNEYKNKYKIYFDFYENYDLSKSEDKDNIDILKEDNENTFNYKELDIEDNPFDIED